MHTTKVRLGHHSITVTKLENSILLVTVQVNVLITVLVNVLITVLPQ